MLFVLESVAVCGAEVHKRARKALIDGYLTANVKDYRPPRFRLNDLVRSIGLTALGGPRFVILTTSERHARERLAEHLAELGRAANVGAGTVLLAAILPERVAVIW